MKITITKRTARFTMYSYTRQDGTPHNGRMTHKDFADWMAKLDNPQITEAV